MITIIFFLALILFLVVMTVVSFTSYMENEDIKNVISIRQKYGIIKNPIEAAYLFHMYEYSKYISFSLSDTLIYFAPVWIGQFIYKKLPVEKPKKESYVDKLDKKYRNGV